MRRIAVFIICLLAFGTSSYASVLDDAHAAAKRGDNMNAFFLTKRAAESGDAAAQYDLANYYYHGAVVKQDVTEGLKWLRRAADQHDVLAQNRLGLLYTDDTGLAQDYGEAVKWFRLAAEQGLANAQFNLAESYRAGRGVPKNLDEAAKLYDLAVKQGDPQSAFALAVMCENSQGMTQDADHATNLFLIYTEGRAEKAYAVGRMYETGDTLPSNHSAAYFWYVASAREGYTKAQRALGAFWSIGKDQSMSLVPAYMWFDVAVTKGDPEATAERDVVARRMTEHQISLARALAKICIDSAFKSCADKNAQKQVGLNPKTP